jgi:hypothetical protein
MCANSGDCCRDFLNLLFKVTPVWQERGRDPNERGPEVIHYNGLEKFLQVIAGDFDLGLK